MGGRTEHFVASRFLGDGEVVKIQGLGSGLINDTYLVTTDSVTLPHFVLQRVNATVFPFPDRIIANLERLSHYIALRADHSDQLAIAHEFRLPSLLSCRDGKNCYIGDSGEYWRALTYIENSRTLDRLETLEDAAQVGFALGCFHNLVGDMDAESMQDSVPGFHVAPLYLKRYDQLSVSGVHRKTPHNVSDLRFCAQFVAGRRNRVPVLERARQGGLLKMQIIHGDPKLNNILFGTRNRKAVAMIDLDTVKPGLIHYDIGDCLRSCCNRAGESVEFGETTGFDLDVCEAILVRYFQERRAFLSRSDIDYLYDAVHLLPLELGLRFLSDYLEGNRYFKVEYPDQNLTRALVQFALVRSVEEQERTIRLLIRKASSCRDGR